jgi:hypothetical protein
LAILRNAWQLEVGVSELPLCCRGIGTASRTNLANKNLSLEKIGVLKVWLPVELVTSHAGHVPRWQWQARGGGAVCVA